MSPAAHLITSYKTPTGPVDHLCSKHQPAPIYQCVYDLLQHQSTNMDQNVPYKHLQHPNKWPCINSITVSCSLAVSAIACCTLLMVKKRIYLLTVHDAKNLTSRFPQSG